MLQLSETLQAPVSFAYRGKDVLEADNPSGVGMTGLLGWGGATEALADCDLLFMLGTDFPYHAFLPSGKTIIQVDDKPLAPRPPGERSTSAWSATSARRCGR